MHQQSREMEWGFALVGQRAAHCQTVAPNGLCFRILPLGDATLDLAHAFDMFLEFGLSVVIGVGDRLGHLFEIMILAQLVWNVGQNFLHRQADRPLRIRDDTADRHRQRLLDLAQQVSQVVLAGTVEATRE